MKKLIIPLAIVVMLALLGAAVAWDCIRLAADAHHRVLLADGEMIKQEIRLVNLLAGSAKTTPEVQSAIANLKVIRDRQSRMEAYDLLVASIRKTTSGIADPTNPLDRKFMDDIAGAINRREMAERQYDDELSAYRDFLRSWRGSVARTFSSQARVDSKQTP